jgi:CDGSH-type Zn-finger protein
MTKPRKISIARTGPYLVSGSVPLAGVKIETNAEGDSIDWGEGSAYSVTETFALCRCGGSSKKPFCDGTHAKIGFHGAETASRETVLDQAQVIEGPDMQLADAQVLCAFGRFCDPNGSVWDQVESSDDPKIRAQFIRQVGNCPSGRLLAIDKATGNAVEPELPQSIGIVENPSQQCSSPLWVRGGIEMIGEDGESYEIRNRMTLCRCGSSENKPFCNGSHASEPKFLDGLSV